MITCKLMGGLGNQLFQIFATISYSIENGRDFRFLNAEKLTIGTIRNTFWNTLLKTLKPFTVQSISSQIIYKEPFFHYSKIPLVPVSQSLMIEGYFQSFKYFENNYSAIVTLLNIRQQQCDLKLHYSDIKFDDCVSMHFRIGDYTTIQHVHPIQTVEYYKTALKVVTNNATLIQSVLYFCEDCDIEHVRNIITQLQLEYPHLQFTRLSGIPDYQEMLVMSCCKDNIIANSTFSWWGAFFNTNPNKTVCYPSKWFGYGVNHNLQDLHPPEWVKIA